MPLMQALAANLPHYQKNTGHKMGLRLHGSLGKRSAAFTQPMAQCRAQHERGGLSSLLDLIPPCPRLRVARVAPALHDNRTLARLAAVAEGKSVVVRCGGILKIIWGSKHI